MATFTAVGAPVAAVVLWPKRTSVTGGRAIKVKNGSSSTRSGAVRHGPTKRPRQEGRRTQLPFCTPLLVTRFLYWSFSFPLMRSLSPRFLPLGYLRTSCVRVRRSHSAKLTDAVSKVDVLNENSVSVALSVPPAHSNEGRATANSRTLLVSQLCICVIARGVLHKSFNDLTHRELHRPPMYQFLKPIRTNYHVIQFTSSSHRGHSFRRVVIMMIPYPNFSSWQNETASIVYWIALNIFHTLCIYCTRNEAYILKFMQIVIWRTPSHTLISIFRWWSSNDCGACKSCLNRSS